MLKFICNSVKNSLNKATIASRLGFTVNALNWSATSQATEASFVSLTAFDQLTAYGWQQEKAERKRVLFLGGANAVKFGHPFHLVGPSPLPFIMSVIFLMGGSHLICMLRTAIRIPTHWVWLFAVAGVIFAWLWEVYREENRGHHTTEVQQGFRIGIMLFILSEVMLFFSFFWGYFHLSLNPSIWIGNAYAPEGVEPFYWWRVPLLNTIILLTSGLSLALAHKTLVMTDRANRYGQWARRFRAMCHLQSDQPKVRSFVESPRLWTADTVLRGFVFLGFQSFEYIGSLFTVNDSVYGSVFYSLTGLHGIHVFVGALMLLTCVVVAQSGKYNQKSGTSYTFNFWSHRVAYDGAAWYWHFVDVVWLLVFIIVYWWGFSA